MNKMEGPEKLELVEWFVHRLLGRREGEREDGNKQI